MRLIARLTTEIMRLIAIKNFNRWTALKNTHLKLGDTRFLPDSDDILFSSKYRDTTA